MGLIIVGLLFLLGLNGLVLMGIVSKLTLLDYKQRERQESSNVYYRNWRHR